MNHIWVIEGSQDGGASWIFYATRSTRSDALEAANLAKSHGWPRSRIVKFVRAS